MHPRHTCMRVILCVCVYLYDHASCYMHVHEHVPHSIRRKYGAIEFFMSTLKMPYSKVLAINFADHH